jgi:hypothetical protein
MIVARKTATRLNPVLVDDAQLAKAHVLAVVAVVIIRERKSVATIQPIEFRNSAFRCSSYQIVSNLLAFFGTHRVIEAAATLTIEDTE